MTADSVAGRLLDAQVAWLLGRLTGPELPDLIARDVDDLLAAGTRVTVGQLVEADEIKGLARLLLTEVSPSAAAGALVSTAAGIVLAGPEERFAIADLIDREHVASLTDEALGMVDLVEAVLERLADSPLVATVAARFVGRIVNDVVQANRAVAERIPGVGSLVAFGANAAGKVIGVADKQLEQVFGDTAGKGAAFAMRRLNKVVVETLKDPTVKDAVLEIFDLYADQPLPLPAEIASAEDAERVARLLQDIIIAGAPTEPVLALLDALVDGFFAVYGEQPASTLVDELGISRDDLVEHANAIVPGILAAAQASGDLERLIRVRLEPFYASDEVAAILAT